MTEKRSPLFRSKSTLVMYRPTDQMKLTVVHEFTFGRNADKEFYSLTYPKRPDVTIFVDAPNMPTKIVVLDPKYKLLSEDYVSEEVAGSPVRADIDKMHTYRDAIRSSSGERAVMYAGIIYPGEEVIFQGGVGAISGLPGKKNINESVWRTLSLALESRIEA